MLIREINVLIPLFNNLDLNFNPPKRISKVFIRDYLIALSGIMPQRYEPNVSSMCNWLYFNNQYNFIDRTQLQKFMNVYGVYVRPPEQDVGNYDYGPWKILLLPWIFCLANFDEELLTSAFSAAFHERGANISRINLLAVSFMADYLLNNKTYQHQTLNNMTNMINTVFALFDEKKLYFYRRFLLDFIRQFYFVQKSARHIHRFTSISVIPQAYTATELKQIQDTVFKQLLEAEWLYDSPIIFKQIIDNVLSWNLELTRENLQDLEAFVYKQLKYKRKNIDSILTVIQSVNTILISHGIQSKTLENMEAKKFLSSIA